MGKAVPFALPMLASIGYGYGKITMWQGIPPQVACAPVPGGGTHPGSSFLASAGPLPPQARGPVMLLPSGGFAPLASMPFVSVLLQGSLPGWRLAPHCGFWPLPPGFWPLHSGRSVEQFLMVRLCTLPRPV